MTRQEFNQLKVGDAVYMPHGKRSATLKGEVYGTQVFEIDRFFKKVRTMFGGFYSYRYLLKKTNRPCRSGVWSSTLTSR